MRLATLTGSPTTLYSSRLGPELAGDDLAGVNADADAQRFGESGQAGIQRRQPGDHVQRGMHGAIRIVVVGKRSAEHRRTGGGVSSL
jgi:hypothetical protein